MKKILIFILISNFVFLADEAHNLYTYVHTHTDMHINKNISASWLKSLKGCFFFDKRKGKNLGFACTPFDKRGVHIFHLHPL